MDVAERQTILTPGYRLGCYRLDSFLGQGGFGVTYLAHDTMLDSPVAIKEYMPESLATRAADCSVHPRSPESAADFQWGLNSFIKEAQTLARFRHPNIVRVMSVFELNGTAYMVMEYENGQDLKTLLSSSGTIPQHRLEQIIGPIVDGLAEVHRHGYIHRDIKPANIRIRNDGTPVLLDFGSARQAAESNSALTALVTAGYAPLEQYTGSDGNSDQQGPWTDIYALGAVLYFAVTGEAPIDSALRGSALLNDKSDPLVPLTQKSPSGYTPAFCRAIDWALSFKVMQRPQSIAQWRVRLLPEAQTFRVSSTQFSSAQTGRQQVPREKEKVSNDSFFAEIDRQASYPDVVIDENLVTTRTLGPDDPTVIQVRPSAKPANTARFDRATDAESADAMDHSWDTELIHDRPVPLRADESPVRTRGLAGGVGDRLKKAVAIGSGVALALALLVLLFPSLLSFDNETDNKAQANSPGVADESGDQLHAGLGDEASIESSPLGATDTAVAQRNPETDSAQVSEISGAQEVRRVEDSQTTASTVAMSTALEPVSANSMNDAMVESGTAELEEQRLMDNQVAARAVQAAEARRQLEIERGRVAERERATRLQARSERQESAGSSAVQSQPPVSSPMGSPLSTAAAAADRANQAVRAQDGSRIPQTSGSRLPVADASSGSQPRPAVQGTADGAVVASLGSPQAPMAESVSTFLPAITDRDMAVVLRQFDSLSLAIEKRDGDALRELTEPSDRKYAYFDYLFRTFDKIEVGVTNISGNRRDQTISGTMHIRRMIRSNGDMAFPPEEFRNIALRSVRNGNWSRINW